MSKQQKNKEITANKALEAIERILSGKLTTPELKQRIKEKKQVKLNQSNVEKEAEISTSSLRNHRAILTKIKELNEKMSSGTEAAKHRPAKASSADLKETKRKLSDAKKRQETLSEQLSDAKSANVAIHAQYVQMIAAIYREVPDERKEHIFEKVIKQVKSNIVPIR